MTELVQDGLELSLCSDSNTLCALTSLRTSPPPRSLLAGSVQIQAESGAYQLRHGLVLLSGELLHLLFKGRGKGDCYGLSVCHEHSTMYEIVIHGYVSVQADTS